MILGFRTQHQGKSTGFVEQILNDVKIHTLRGDPNKRWKPGNSIQFATGVRTKNYWPFMKGECKSIQEVRINNQGILTISIDGRLLQTKAEYDEFVQNDGFASQAEFEAWFAPLIEKSWREQERALHLRCIHWTDKRY